MAKSSETYNKKEKEKKRLKKQQDKKERAEERKANVTKGKSLEDMMAYVDADGNITSTPPDPTKKRQLVAAEDIQLGVPKQQDIVEDVVRKGTITMFNDSKGFGFIRDNVSQESIFVHISAMLEQLREGDKVTFEITQGPKGLTATKVKKA
jgi:cold shock CspA family protein